MNRFASTLAVSLVLAWSTAAGTRAGQLSAAESYFATRGAGHVLTAPFETIRLHPTEYRAGLIEIRGTVTGNARRTDGATVVLTTPNSGTYMIEVTGNAALQALDAG